MYGKIWSCEQRCKDRQAKYTVKEHTWYKDNMTSHTVPRATATQCVNSSLYTCVLYHYMQSAYIKLKETLLNSVIWPWIYFPAAAKGVAGCLCFIWLFPFLCLPSLKSRCWDILSGSGCKGRMEPAIVRGGGLVVSLQTDQITAGISSSVSIRSKEVNPPESIWAKSVTSLMDMHHLHLNVRIFAFQFN